MLHKILLHLGIPENAHRVYLHLVEKGPTSARQLAENLNMPRPSVYDNLELLMKRGLVVDRYEENRKMFQVDDVKNLSRLIQEKMDALRRDEQEFNTLLPNLARQTKTIEPKIRFYSGVEGVRHVLQDMLWYDNTETLTMWPISEMIEILGDDYLADLNRKRIRQKISIRGIWPRNKAVNLKKYPFLGVGKEHLRELRLAPPKMSWNMSYWLYADKVAFISSRKETFGFVVHSKDFTELMQTQFEIIWDLSKPIKPQPKYTNAFLKTL
jgi:sugar-specific transcriptional regulator TrmB